MVDILLGLALYAAALAVLYRRGLALRKAVPAALVVSCAAVVLFGG
jgi:hypothetical protein